MKIILDEKYRVGHPVIDEQHARLLEYFKNALDLLKVPEQKRSDPFLNLITDIRDYAKRHLDYEELQMHKEKYPLIEEHKRLHEVFREKVTEYNSMTKYDYEKAKVLTIFLKEWFVNHISVEDIKFGHFLAEKKQASSKEAA